MKQQPKTSRVVQAMRTARHNHELHINQPFKVTEREGCLNTTASPSVQLVADKVGLEVGNAVGELVDGLEVGDAVCELVVAHF